MTTIHSIGHSTHPIEHLLALLRAQEIAVLADVRSKPYSRRVPQYGKRPLSERLHAAGIDYAFLGAALGGRPDDPALHDAEGRLDHAALTQSAAFRAGIERLIAIGEECPTAMMCAEEDPSRCHRRFLLTPPLEAAGVTVLHLRGDGRVQRESELPPLPGRQLRLFR